MPSTGIAVWDLGRIGYAPAMELQAELVRRRQAGGIGDVLLLLDHPPVVTVGKNANRANVLLSPAALAERGIELADCDRGGDVTYHGPGQIVGYPILDLHASPRRMGPVDYVRLLEEILIRVGEDCSVPSRRVPGLTGVWTLAEPPRKWAAIGVHFARGVTSHGFALNLDPDPGGFAAIVPCGIRGHGVTALRLESPRPPDRSFARAALLRHFAAVLQRDLAEEPVSWDHKSSQFNRKSEG